MKKINVYLIPIVSIIILSITLKMYDWNWIKISLSSISSAASIISVLYFLWDKLLWKIPAKKQWRIYKKPYISGQYKVKVEWETTNTKKKKESRFAEITIIQNSNSIQINYLSDGGESKSGYVDIVCVNKGYEIYYHYYMKPSNQDCMTTNPAHNGSAKIRVINNKIVNWEYFTNRGTRGSIFVIE